MQHKIESKHIGSLKTLNLPCDNTFKMCSHSLCCHFAHQEIQRARTEIRALAATREARPGGLSGREVDVLRLAAKGLTTREIADCLYISAKTADRHIQNLYTKIGASNRAAATRWALEHGLVT